VRQTTLSVVLEVEPASAGRLSRLIEEFKAKEQLTQPIYHRLKDGMPTLHFMSLSVFNGADYDPVFVLEVNFDYRAGPFWAQFEATVGDQLRPMLRCCKRPMDSAGPLFDAITAFGSRYPIAPYLENRTLAPSVYHHGNRGLSRDRILREGELFLATRTELAQPNLAAGKPYRGIPAEKIHERLRGAMLGPYPWLSKPERKRITLQERAVDIARLFGLLLAVLFALSIPGLSFLVFLRAFFPSYAIWFLEDKYALLVLLVPLFTGVILYAKASARRGEAAASRSGGLTPSFQKQFTSLANPFTLALAAIVAVVLVAAAFGVIGAALASVYDVVLIKTVRASIKAYDAAHAGFFDALVQAARAWTVEFRHGVESFLPAAWIDFKKNFWPMFRLAWIGIYTAFLVSLPAIFVWLRWLERRDSHHDAPTVDQRELRKMTHREDWVPQNHMGSVVLVKPGVLRMALFRTGHFGLGLLLRVVATDGYLGSMRTVHFAHWAFVNNGSRLMFFSNFDHSWDSYLDDFIEKAHGGLTLAWGSGVGFPPTRFLVMDGASHGRLFKTWARHSMAVSRFWFSAYTEYTVDQIERHARIADGLRRDSLTPTEAAEWAKDL
jgi:hypothetical protein